MTIGRTIPRKINSFHPAGLFYSRVFFLEDMDERNQIQVFCLKDFTRLGFTGQRRISSKSVLDRSHYNQTNQKKKHLHKRYAEWIMGSFIIGL